MKHAWARAVAVPLALAVVTSAFAGSIEIGDRLEMAAVLSAPISPTMAVHVAENGGGHAFIYGMEANPHGHWYEVSVLRGGDKLLLKIDATSGRVIGSSPARGEDAQGAHALATSSLSFARAIAEAERVGGGPALEANAAGQGEHAHVDVDVIQEQGKRLAHYRVLLQAGQVRVVLTGTDS